MMNYEEFKEYVTKNILNFAPEYMKNAKVEIRKVNKNNIVLDAIVLNDGSGVRPTVYVEGMYKEYVQTYDFDNAMRNVWASISNLEKPKVNMDFDKARIIPQLINTEWNKDMLDFNMEISDPDFFITYYERFKPHEVERFFEWSEKNYGSRPGVISFFPYTQEKFEKAIRNEKAISNGINKNYDFNRAIGMLIMYEYEKCDEFIFYQIRFEDNIDRYCEENGLYDFPDMQKLHENNRGIT